MSVAVSADAGQCSCKQPARRLRNAHAMLNSPVAVSLASALTLQALVLLQAQAVCCGGAAEPDATAAAAADGVAEGRGHFKKMMMNPYMLIPQLISLGFAPIVLANLKMMVMSALMINNMALNAAIFMTVRNMVFGPRPTVKYTNYGYREPPLNRGHPERPQYQHRDAESGQLQQSDDAQPPWTDEMATWDRQRKRRKDA